MRGRVNRFGWLFPWEWNLNGTSKEGGIPSLSPVGEAGGGYCPYLLYGHVPPNGLPFCPFQVCDKAPVLVF